MEKSDHCRLLRARRARPKHSGRERRTAEHRDDFAPPHLVFPKNWHHAELIKENLYYGPAQDKAAVAGGLALGCEILRD